MIQLNINELYKAFNMQLHCVLKFAYTKCVKLRPLIGVTINLRKTTQNVLPSAGSSDNSAASRGIEVGGFPSFDAIS